MQQPSEGGNTVARRASGSTVDLRAASETNSTTVTATGVTTTSGFATFCVPNKQQPHQSFRLKNSRSQTMFRFKTLRRLLGGYRPGEGRL